MRILRATAGELEEPHEALAQINSAVEKQGGLLKYTVGLVSCNFEFLDTGTFCYLAENLNFPIFGLTTTSNATNGEVEPFQFSLLIFTSDLEQFSLGLSDPFVDPTIPPQEENVNAKILRTRKNFEKLYQEGISQLSGPPTLGIVCFPLIYGFSDEILTQSLFRLTQIPFFGSFPVENYHAQRRRYPSVLFHEEDYQDRAALLLFQGITPKFFYTDTFKDSIARQKAIITKSEGNILREVNDRPVVDFLLELGMVQKNLLLSINSNPFVIYKKNTEKYQPRIAHELLPDGGILCNGPLPQGSILSLGIMDKEGILNSAQTLFERVKNFPGLTGALIYSCLNRQLNLFWDDFREIKLLDSMMGEDAPPWLMSYSGGEICPTRGPEGDMVNSFLNLSAIALAFQDEKMV
ncbi:MAG: FIST C-terminal domain-containing protein [Deltaproteobacteria bacterium]|jgi:hypothetical protein|nr:FIST C-terminal domain-containing protein [Deltaproteobacteria bacterium]